MNRYINPYCIIVLLIAFIIVLNGCTKDAKENIGIDKTINPEKLMNNETENHTKESVEAKEVIKKYFDSLTKSNLDEQNKYCASTFKSNELVKIDKIEIIKIVDDKDDKIKNAYMANAGTVTNPYDAICFEVTYNIQYNKNFEKMATEYSGEKTKFITLIKETESSSWLVDELGY